MLTGEEQMHCAITDIFRKFIAAKGLNMSRQRALVLDAFLSEMQQISVDDLFIKLRTKHPAIGRSTVYRTMKLLAECGIARFVLVDGTCWYEKSLATSQVLLRNGKEPVIQYSGEEYRLRITRQKN